MKTLLLLTALLLIGFVADASAADIPITISDQRFSEDNLKIKAGDSVLFTNDDKISYNIQVVDSKGNVNDAGLQKPGDTVKSSFADAGDYKVICGLHPHMVLKIKVQ